jgi:hypothetical protein
MREVVELYVKDIFKGVYSLLITMWRLVDSENRKASK